MSSNKLQKCSSKKYLINNNLASHKEFNNYHDLIRILRQNLWKISSSMTHALCNTPYLPLFNLIRI